MKVTRTNNLELVIQAKNETDFALAKSVAERMIANGSGQVVASEGSENGGWLQLTGHGYQGAAEDNLCRYREAKSEVLKEAAELKVAALQNVKH